ncbi:MAG TPA: tRNA glutamyl-Q(34) synthetase GluQRS [Rhizobiales bacterium]|nr:tRNA glutamyl-Q(34) synthetase GluQRS [Hyphomicrobiales bacterium]
MRPVFRFAPSPNGRLHLGHAFSALVNQRMAQGCGGRLLLRIEDIDVARCTPEFEAAIYRDLEWLGIEWETPVRRQSEHFGEYRDLLGRLIEEELVYPAFMSRGEVRAAIVEAEAKGGRWPRDPDGAPLYPGLDRTLGARERRRRIDRGDPFAWRLDSAAALERIARPLAWTEYADMGMQTAASIDARPQDWGDVVIARRDVPTSYLLSVVADDALQGVDRVVRGRDLYLATSVQRLLQELFGFAPPAYFHHRLVTGPDGRKLSKSAGDSGIAELRERGATPAEIRSMVGLD